MMIFYMDDTGGDRHVGFLTLGISSGRWKESYREVLNFRRQLAKDHRIPFDSELHATEFIGGRGSAGRSVKDRETRIEIFNSVLDFVASLKGATLLCAFDKDHREARLYERLMNRINICVKSDNGHAILISDEGKNDRFRALARKLGSYNPIPSQFGSWKDGSLTQNIPNDHILEDIIFRRSSECKFIQLADFCAYALYRMEIEHPTTPELSKSFLRLKPICNTKAFANDPRKLGIVRGS